MKVTIEPSVARGNIVAPPSKSMAHRMLLGAGLSCGTSTVHNIELSEDIKSTLDILEALGARYSVEGNVVTMQGIGGGRVQVSDRLNCRESGSTLRFFIPLVLTGGGTYEFYGARRLFARPLGIYEDICKAQGITFVKTEDSLTVSGQLQVANYKVPGNISSQFITGLLFALPLLAGDSTLEILPPVESKAYIEMTLEALETYGISIKREDNTFYIKGSQTYQAKNVTVEGDYSNAAFLEAFNLIGGEVCVGGLKEDSLQGDKVYRAYFEQLQNGAPTLDISECPDLGPILMGMAASLNGARFTGTKRLAIKESDRGAVMAEELLKFGIACDVKENEITVFAGKLQKPAVPTDSHNDHRIAMTMALLHSQVGGCIDDAGAVKKSFPTFYQVIEKLGINLTIE